jgi:hypothetical protein
MCVKKIPRDVLFAIVFAVELLNSGCGPLPVSVGEHTVSPDVETNTPVSLSSVMVSAPLDAEKAKEIVNAIEEAGAKIDMVSGTDCMAAFLVGTKDDLPQPISRFFEPDYKSRTTNFRIDYIIILGQSSTDSRETEIVATVINYGEASQATTAQIHAEGKMRAFWPILPYVALFVFYSEPDTESSTTLALASLVSQIIKNDGKSAYSRILFLESNNLVKIARSVPRFTTQPDSQKPTSEDHEENDQPKKMYDPVELYKVMIGRGETADQNDPVTASMPYNPIAHALAIPTVIMLSPMLWIIDKTLVEKSPRVSTEQSQSSRWDFLIYAENAIKRQDWEAAYRLLEDGLISSDEVIKHQSHQVLKRYPEIMDGAKESFTEESFRETVTKHGDSAYKIEDERMAIYRTVATPAAYADAEKSFSRVFSKENSN